MLQSLLQSRITCFLTFFKYPLEVLAKIPATCILMYCNAFSLFLLPFVASNSGKRYWDWTLPRIRAQIELSSTFVYDYKMSWEKNASIMYKSLAYYPLIKAKIVDLGEGGRFEKLCVPLKKSRLHPCRWAPFAVKWAALIFSPDCSKFLYCWLWFRQTQKLLKQLDLHKRRNSLFFISFRKMVCNVFWTGSEYYAQFLS